MLAGLTIGWTSWRPLWRCRLGLRAGSLALVAFGLDSMIEVLSAWVVVAVPRRVERRVRPPAGTLGARLIGLTFFVLAAYVAFAPVRELFFVGVGRRVSGGHRARGAVAAGHADPGLAKKRTAAQLGSPTLRADATETLPCAWLSLVALEPLLEAHQPPAPIELRRALRTIDTTINDYVAHARIRPAVSRFRNRLRFGVGKLGVAVR